MLILAITNQKGGVGKTTTAVTLAHDLARGGKKVLLVDLDTQGHVADCLGLEKRPGLKALIDGYVDGGDFDGAVFESGRRNLDVVLSDKRTAATKRQVSALPLSEYVLRDALRALAGDYYDLAVLDTAPGADIFQVSALCACTHFLVPVLLDALAVKAAGDALKTAASLERIGAAGGRLLGVLPTMWERTTSHSQRMLEVLGRQFGSLLWSPIPTDTRVREAAELGLTVWEYAPVGRAASGIVVNGRPVGGYVKAVERLEEELFGG